MASLEEQFSFLVPDPGAKSCWIYLLSCGKPWDIKREDVQYWKSLEKYLVNSKSNPPSAWPTSSAYICFTYRDGTLCVKNFFCFSALLYIVKLKYFVTTVTSYLWHVSKEISACIKVETAHLVLQSSFLLSQKNCKKNNTNHFTVCIEIELVPL